MHIFGKIYQMYAIIDIETTGLRVNEDKITEIAIYIHDGNEVIDTFHSLINPERYLPEFITQLTGITNEMLEQAPKFYEIARQIVEITEGKVFVAHNAHFDYTFVKNEFKNLGFNYQRKTLCTVRLSRKIYPHLPSYSLGNLCKHFGIINEKKHRAGSDALATVKLLEILLSKNENKAQKNIIDNEIKVKTLPPKLSYETFEKLPEATGVYYFYDEAGSIIYIGKSKNIKKRIASHFSTNLNNRKTIEVKNRVADIGFEITGSELIALLLESDEIKVHKPLFNRAQRRSHFQYGIFMKKNRSGYYEFFVERTKTQTKPALYLAANAQTAREMLRRKVEQHTLCMKLCNLYESKGACFAYQIKQCQGACIQEEAPETYNERFLEALDSFNQFARKSFMIITQGRETTEKTLVCVENGRYLGWGYIDQEAVIQNLEDAKQYIKRYKDNRDIQKIIWAWVKKYPQDVRVFKTVG